MKIVNYKTWKDNEIQAANTITTDRLSKTPHPGRKSYESGINYLSPKKINTSIFAYMRYLIHEIKTIFTSSVNPDKINIDDNFISDL